MLTRKQANLVDATEPIAFPVYGRGRALWPMPGSDITAANIESTMEFLCGSCSCQIKDQNPGYDLMLCVDWEQLIENRLVGQTEMPELTGPSADAPDQGHAVAPMPAHDITTSRDHQLHSHTSFNHWPNRPHRHYWFYYNSIQTV